MGGRLGRCSDRIVMVCQRPGFGDEDAGFIGSFERLQETCGECQRIMRLPQMLFTTNEKEDLFHLRNKVQGLEE
jgi:hypothetical protein